MIASTDVTDLVAAMTRQAQPFALAAVVRTLSATAAKAGSKAVILPDGTVGAGWIGGGCARGAVLRAARDAMADGRPRLISVRPENQLRDSHVKAGETRDSVEFARNACASRGTMDVFVEPVLPPPRLLIYGASPVAVALAHLAPEFGFGVTVHAPKADHTRFKGAASLVDGFSGGPSMAVGYIVIGTQGRGDAEALGAALEARAPYTAFVGSPRKVAAFKTTLLAEGFSAAQLERLRGPAGLNIGAVTPEEIALSILAEIVRERRRSPQRQVKAN
jgi:xanthine dehydrogenase accessory factor